MTRSELCIKCQACCKVLQFEIPTLQETINFYRNRGLKLVTKGLNPLRLIVVVPHVCQHLTPAGCAIYKNRPYSCKAFDGTKSPAVWDVCLWNKEDTE